LIETSLTEDALWIGEMRGIDVEGERLLVVRYDDGVCVFRDRCPHQGYPLSEGKLEAGVITCRVHQHTFGAVSGDGINPPRPCLTKVLARVEAGQIWVELPASRKARP
jgi:toluene monooxygenase system ferredoxin subunit